MDAQFMAGKQRADGELLQKSPRSNGHSPMPIERLLNPGPIEKKKPKAPRNGLKEKTKKANTKPGRIVPKFDPPERYEVVSVDTNSSSGITFGQTWKGDAAAAKKELDHRFKSGRLKPGVVEEGPGHEDQEQEEK